MAELSLLGFVIMAVLSIWSICKDYSFNKHQKEIL